jgi:hypothetical protein
MKKLLLTLIAISSLGLSANVFASTNVNTFTTFTQNSYVCTRIGVCPPWK